MDQGHIDGLTLGLDTDLHKHDQRYYTETEIDASLTLYYTKVELDAGQLDSRYYTETEIDANIYTKTEVDTALGLKANDADVLKHDGTIPLSNNWDVGAANILYIDTIRSRLATDTGLTLANRGGTGYIYIDDGSFNVGINMIPGKILDIYSPTTNPIIRMEVGEIANCFISFQDKDTTSDGEVYLGAVGNDMVLFANGYQALRLTTLGVLDVANSACVLDEDTLGTDSDTHLATQQSIKAYIDNKSYLDLGSILTGDGAYVGTKMTVTVDDASTVFGDVLAQAADFNYDRADASAAATSVGLVMALSSGSGSKEVLIEGQVCETDWTWSAGLLYLSITTGKMTQTAPVASGEQVVAVGWALSADTIYFKPSLVLAEIA